MDQVAEAVEALGEGAEVRAPIAELGTVGRERGHGESEAVLQLAHGLVERVLGTAAGEEGRGHQDRRPVIRVGAPIEQRGVANRDPRVGADGCVAR